MIAVSIVNHLSTFLFTLTCAFAWHLLASRRSRGDSFFGVRVEPGFAQSETGRAIFQHFRFRLWSLTVFAGIVAQFLGPAGIGAGIVLSYLLGWFVFAEAHRRTLREAPLAPVPALRVASPAAERERADIWLDVLDWVVMILPPGIPAAALLFLVNRPSPNPWLLFTVCFAFVLGLTCAATQWTLRFRARSSDWASTPSDSRRFRTYLGVMLTMAFMNPICGICLIALLPGMVFFAAFVLLSLPVSFAAHRIRSWLTSHLDPRSIDPMSDSCWKWGWCYWNPSDPAIVVPLRTGVGLSFNGGRVGVRLAYVVLTGMTVASLVMTTLLSSHVAHMIR